MKRQKAKHRINIAGYETMLTGGTGGGGAYQWQVEAIRQSHILNMLNKTWRGLRVQKAKTGEMKPADVRSGKQVQRVDGEQETQTEGLTAK